jgi:hypothetical protein
MNHFAKKELEKFPFKVEVFQVCSLVAEIIFHTAVRCKAISKKLERSGI